MEIKQQVSNIKSSGNVEKHDFKITASAKAFSILSSNIYQDKVQAIIRELSCNAVDAHVAAGHSKPFDVKLPTLLFQQFEIRDYGIGLSHEDMMELYTTYFESTKTDSNLFVGALGLGSKSPFSYTKTFTVQSYFNGVVRTYQAFMAGGVPAITLATTEETTEPNGLRVIVPVKADDADNRWVRAAKYVYRTFDKIRPNIDCDIDYLEFNSDGVAVITLNSKPAKQFYVVMGGVQYPVEFELVIGEKKPTFSELFKNTITFLKVSIGSVDIEPGREGLSYDKKTIDYLNLSIDRVENIIKDRIVRDIKNESSLRLAAVKQHKILNKLNSNYGTTGFNLFREALANINYNGVDVSFKDNIEPYLTSMSSYRRATSAVLGLTVCRSDSNDANTDLIMTRINQKNTVQPIIETPRNIMIIHKLDNGASPERLIKAMRNKLRAENKLDQYSHFLVVTQDQADKTTQEIINHLGLIFGDECTTVMLDREDQNALIKDYFSVKVDGIDTPAVKSGSTSKTNIEIKSVTTMANGEIDYKHQESLNLNSAGLNMLIDSYIADEIPVMVYGSYRNTYVPIDQWESYKTSSKIIMSERDLSNIVVDQNNAYKMPEQYVILVVKSDLMPTILKMRSKVICFDSYIREQVVDKIKSMDIGSIPTIGSQAKQYSDALKYIAGVVKRDDFNSDSAYINHIIDNAHYGWYSDAGVCSWHFQRVIDWINENKTVDRLPTIEGLLLKGAKDEFTYRLCERAPKTLKTLCEPLKRYDIDKMLADYEIVDDVKVIINRLNWLGRYSPLYDSCYLHKICKEVLRSESSNSYDAKIFKFIAENDYQLFIMLCGLSERHVVSVGVDETTKDKIDSDIAARVSKILEDF